MLRRKLLEDFLKEYTTIEATKKKWTSYVAYILIK